MMPFILAGWTLLPIALLPPSGQHDAGPAQIQALITQLGSKSFSWRESAMRTLDALGLPCLAELKKAAHGNDPEVRRRAEILVEAIERRQQSARLLAPLKLHLKLDDVPLEQAVSALAAKSGFAVHLDPALTEKVRAGA